MTSAANLLSLDQLSGTYPDGFSTGVAEKLGRAFPTFIRRQSLSQDTICLGWTDEPASRSLRDAFLSGLVLSGAHVLDLEAITESDFHHYINQNQRAVSVFIGPRSTLASSQDNPEKTDYCIRFFIQGNPLQEASLSKLVNIADAGDYYSGAGQISFLESKRHLSTP